MADTEHLAVFSRAPAALAPCSNVVRVHFGEPPYLALIGSMTDCAEWTIGCAIGFGSFGLVSVSGPPGRFVEHSYIQKLRVFKPPENVFEYPATVLDVRVAVEPRYFSRNTGRIVRLGMMLFIKLTPIQPLHFLFDIPEHARNPF